MEHSAVTQTLSHCILLLSLNVWRIIAYAQVNLNTVQAKLGLKFTRFICGVASLQKSP